MSSPSQTPALDLAQFEGNLDECQCDARDAGDPICVLCTVRKAAPDLLAECRRLQAALADAARPAHPEARQISDPTACGCGDGFCDGCEAGEGVRNE